MLPPHSIIIIPLLFCTCTDPVSIWDVFTAWIIEMWMNTNLKWHLVSFPTEQKTLILGLPHTSSASWGHSHGSYVHAINQLCTVLTFLSPKRLPLVKELLTWVSVKLFIPSYKIRPGSFLSGAHGPQLAGLDRSIPGKQVEDKGAHNFSVFLIQIWTDYTCLRQWQ